MVREVRGRLNRRRDTVELVVIPFSDADPAVSRRGTPIGTADALSRQFGAERPRGVP